MDWNLYGLEVSLMYLETRDSERAVVPVSTHANANMLSHISGGILVMRRAVNESPQVKSW